MATKKRSAARVSDPAPPAIVHKLYVADEVKAVDEAERTIRFRITTGDVDREKDVVDPRGWQVDEYMKNPVVLFGHDYKSLPVARALSIAADDRGLSMVAQFPTKEVYPFADTVYQMVKGGFLNATSVGFKPVKWNLDPERGGVTYSAQTLLEASIVPIPANPMALVEARSLGIDTDPLRDWATKILALDVEAPAESVTKETDGVEGDAVTKDAPADPPALSEELPASPPPVNQTKAGRVLSGRNESALREALAAVNAAVERVNSVLAQVESGQDEDEDEDDNEPADDASPAAASGDDAKDREDLQPILTISEAAEVQITKDMAVFRLVDDPEPRFTLDPAMLSEVIARGYLTSLAAVVDARVGAALSALRGRID